MPKVMAEEEKLKQILKEKKDELMNPLNMSLAPIGDPVWVKVSNDLDNKIAPNTARWRAYTDGFRELALRDMKNNNNCPSRTTRSAAIADRQTRGKMTREKVLNVFFNRKNEILRPKNTFLVPVSNPVWTSIATQMGNVYTPKALHNMVATNEKYRRLVLVKEPPESDAKSNVAKKEKNPVETKKKNDLRDEINKIMSEDTILKLINTTDSLAANIRELIEDNKLNRQILNELRNLSADFNEFRKLHVGSPR